MDQTLELFKNVAILFILVMVSGIVALIFKRRRQRLQSDVFTLLFQAESDNDFPRALELVREFLCAPCGIEGIFGVFRNGQVDTAMELLNAQMSSVNYLREIYQHAKAPAPQEVLDKIVGTIANQREILGNDKLFSILTSTPKKEFVNSFQAAQQDKERLAQLLPSFTWTPDAAK